MSSNGMMWAVWIGDEIESVELRGIRTLFVAAVPDHMAAPELVRLLVGLGHPVLLGLPLFDERADHVGPPDGWALASALLAAGVTVTIEVTPEQMRRLPREFPVEHGRLHLLLSISVPGFLSMRHPADVVVRITDSPLYVAWTPLREMRVQGPVDYAKDRLLLSAFQRGHDRAIVFEGR